jgi:hypothetical protein
MEQATTAMNHHYRWTTITASLLVAASLLRAGLVWETTTTHSDHLRPDMDYDGWWFVHEVTISCVQYLVMIGFLYGILLLIQISNNNACRQEVQTRNQNPSNNNNSNTRAKDETTTTNSQRMPQPPASRHGVLWIQVYMAMLLPTLFQMATILVVSIWESSPTVRQLGSLLVLVYQWMGLVTLMMMMMMPTTTSMTQQHHPKIYYKVAATGVLAVTLLVRATVVATIRSNQVAVQCSGLELNISDFFAVSWPTSLCLA